MTIAIDFDGVISNYTGWKGVPTLPGPIPGARESIKFLRAAGNKIIVHTCRSDIDAVKHYLDEYMIEYDYINFNPDNESLFLNDKKILADLYIDDRAIHFNGSWTDTLSKIDEFKPWWRK